MESVQTRPSLLLRMRDPGDAVAWREFESRYGELVLRYARARGLQHCDAEDIRQLVFTKLFRRFPTFEYLPRRGRFRDYLGMAVRNTISAWAACPERAVRPVDPDVLAHTKPCEAPGADPVWDKEWVDHHFRVAWMVVSALVEPRSMRVFHSLLDGRSLQDVAVAEGMSTEAVRKIRLRVRERLTEQIRRQMDEEDGCEE